MAAFKMSASQRLNARSRRVSEGLTAGVVTRDASRASLTGLGCHRPAGAPASRLGLAVAQRRPAGAPPAPAGVAEAALAEGTRAS